MVQNGMHRLGHRLLFGGYQVVAAVRVWEFGKWMIGYDYWNLTALEVGDKQLADWVVSYLKVSEVR